MLISKGYLLPHAPVFIGSVGGEQSLLVQKSIDAYHKVADEIAELKPDLIVVISPHGPVFTDAIALYDLDEYTGNFRAFGDFESDYKFQKDELMLNKLYEESQMSSGSFYALKPNEFIKFQYKPELDHGVLVPLHFINQKYHDFKVLAMSYGSLSYSELMKNGKIMHDVITKSYQNVVVIASGDMSHALKSDGPYTFHEDGVIFDHEMCEYIENQRPYEIFRLESKTISNAAECGLRSLSMLLGCMNKYDLKSELISYEAPFGVGYLFASYEVVSESDKDEREDYIAFEKRRYEALKLKEHTVVKLARQTIEYYINNNRKPIVGYKDKAVEINNVVFSNDIIEKLLEGKYGVFVSIKLHGNLRGCIGTIFPTQKNGVEEIVKNSISACARDYRFDPLTFEELQDIIINVDILSPLTLVDDITLLDPRIYGVVVSHKDRMGVLLPDIEGVTTIEEQLTIASNKGGFNVDEIEKIESFTVERYF